MKGWHISLLLALLAVSCSVQDSTVKVGVVAPFTGDFASYGDDLRRGLEMAKEDINQAGGINGKELEVIYEDACMPKDTFNAAKKLTSVNNVDFMITFCIIGTVPVSTITEPEKMNLMLIAAVPDNVLEAGENIFSVLVASRTEAKAQAEYAYNVLDARTASVVYIDTDLGKSYNDNFIKHFEELGGEVLSTEQLAIDGADFRTELSKVKDLDPDAVLSIHLGNQGGIILQQMGALGMDIPTISYYQGEKPIILELAGKAAEGFIVSTPNKINKTEKQQKFVDRFEERYGETPSVITTSTYDTLSLQAMIYEKCEGNRDCMHEEMYSVENYDGVSGTFSIGPEGAAIRDFIFKQVRNGTFVKIY